MMKKIILFTASILTFILFCSCNTKQKDTLGQKSETKAKLMWVDATANIHRFNNKDTIDFYLHKLNELGFTDVVVDIRPISGHVLYDSKYAPKLTEWNGKSILYTFDYLGYFIEKAHKEGMRVQASMNTFVAGHNYVNRGIIYEDNKSDWASVVYPPSEDRKFIPITEEKQKYSAMVNPVNEEFQEYILNLFAEVAEKYPKLDGIILDRVRYDGFTADFSELSRQKFEEYIGKKLDKYPDDIYLWKKDTQGNFYPERGKYFLQWVEWRSQVIHDFMVKARNKIKSVNPDLSFGDYTGAWYPTYFEVGVNFASKDYDPSKEYDWATPTYKNTGYAELIDLFTVGNYYTTITIEDYLEKNPAVKNETDMHAQSSLWYCVEGSCQNLRNIMGENKFIGGILADQFYDNPEGLTESIKMNLQESDGVMIFDIVHIIDKNLWDYVEKGMLHASDNP
ncbi:alpha amylase family protein [Limibacterium fermenti]|jgi:uncharacterized lipoprotein YddW (UPF0748 family)|uniref:alpha amylase family protein n=1 Tax=Limibacterium fermenti TaxID=3229863 RepID=UPI000E80E0CF|nr:S-layer protein [Porphyromonadaceae bacterium]HBX19871.1 S-layer protein [Porphyromonadaceae bacterium]HCM20268.1 S-layer protein [Porphyromonadaceae bacterium]